MSEFLGCSDCKDTASGQRPKDTFFQFDGQQSARLSRAKNKMSLPRKRASTPAFSASSSIEISPSSGTKFGTLRSSIAFMDARTGAYSLVSPNLTL